MRQGTKVAFVNSFAASICTVGGMILGTAVVKNQTAGIIAAAIMILTGIIMVAIVCTYLSTES